MKYYLVKSLINTTIDYYILYVTNVTTQGVHINGFQAIINFNLQDLILKKDIIRYNQLKIYHRSDNIKDCENHLKIIQDSKKYNI